jgi:hypothetical protein
MTETATATEATTSSIEAARSLFATYNAHLARAKASQTDSGTASGERLRLAAPIAHLKSWR